MVFTFTTRFPENESGKCIGQLCLHEDEMYMKHNKQQIQPLNLRMYAQNCGVEVDQATSHLCMQ